MNSNGGDPFVGVVTGLIEGASQCVAFGRDVSQDVVGDAQEFLPRVIGALPVVPLDPLGDDRILGGFVQAADVGAQFIPVGGEVAELVTCASRAPYDRV